LKSHQPATHAPTTQAPTLHAGAETFCVTGQTFPHVAQLLASQAVLISHPFDGSASQSVHPQLQPWTVQLPAVQPGLAFGRLQAAPHTPQFAGSDVRLVSQPSDALPSQSE
jgi:hypothetical protein